MDDRGPSYAASWRINVFEVDCDASKIRINGVLNQECHPATYFSEKLNEAKQKYSTYDNKFYLHQHPSRRQVVV